MRRAGVRSERRGFLRTRFGWCGLAWKGTVLSALTLPRPTKAAALHELSALGFERTPHARVPDLFTRALRRAFEGRPFRVPHVDLSRLTPFQRRVLRATRRIPRGETRTYGWVARACGCPRASRAVGGALHINPVPLFIPCHRVTAAGGKLGGFGSGLPMKRLLLALEGVRWDGSRGRG